MPPKPTSVTTLALGKVGWKTAIGMALLSDTLATE